MGLTILGALASPSDWSVFPFLDPGLGLGPVPYLLCQCFLPASLVMFPLGTFAKYGVGTLVVWGFGVLSMPLLSAPQLVWSLDSFFDRRSWVVPYLILGAGLPTYFGSTTLRVGFFRGGLS